jgi:hypothetical protein
MEIKNNAAKTSLRGIVSTFAMAPLLDSATITPAKKAPVATDNPSHFATNDNPKANPRITTSSIA